MAVDRDYTFFLATLGPLAGAGPTGTVDQLVETFPLDASPEQLITEVRERPAFLASYGDNTQVVAIGLGDGTPFWEYTPGLVELYTVLLA